MKYVEENRKIWDKRSEQNDIWSVPVSEEEISLARKGIWSIVLTPQKAVPASWFPEYITGKKVLCLASGGGQQAPILAAAGADVIVLDNSKKQLEKDEFVARRDNLVIGTVQGNMQDLSMFSDEYFDLFSNSFFASRFFKSWATVEEEFLKVDEVLDRTSRRFCFSRRRMFALKINNL